MVMKMKKWIAGVAAAVLISGFFALPQAMAGVVTIINNSPNTIEVITFSSTNHASVKIAAKSHGAENTFSTASVTKIVVKMQTASNTWVTKAEYPVSTPAALTKFAVTADANGNVTVRLVQEIN